MTPRTTALILAACGTLVFTPGVLAQRVPRTNPATPQSEPPTIVGKVVAYEAEKSIVLETADRNGVKKSEFTIAKDKTRIELPPRIKEISVGRMLAVWADKDDPKLAARITSGNDLPAVPNTRRPNNRGQPVPTLVGKVVAYEADTSITVEVRQRNSAPRQTEFSIVKDQTKVELLADAKALAVGMTVSVWADKENPKLAARIAAGANNAPAQTPRRPNNAPTPPASRAATDPPGAPVVDDRAKRPIRPPVVGLAPADVADQIDKHVQARLAAEKLPASPASDDAEFIRRVFLDITGVIPPAEKVAVFLDSQDSNKRSKLIDELLDSPQYGWHFGDLWCDRIAVKDTPIYRDPFIDWMAESLNQGRGWDELVSEMLTAEGKFGLLTRSSRLRPEDPRALLMVLNTEGGAPAPKPNPALLAADSARLFLGVQIQCAECHDHPFSSAWKQTDFWGLAAFFGQFRAVSANPGFYWQETPVAADQGVSIAIPPTSLKNIGQIVPARLLGDDRPFQSGDLQLLRQALARWLTAVDNPYFARATINRLWADFFGRGLVTPVDDLRPDNPPSHPEVLQLLANELTRSNFDLKHLIRCLCLSQTYQRSSVPLAENDADQEKFSHMAIKVLGPGVFYDCLTTATGFAELKIGLPERKTKLTVATTFTPREVFVDFFRSSQGEEPNPLENTHGIPQALKLMNAAQLNSVPPVVERLAGSGQSHDQVVEQLYLTALARRPSVAEAQLMTDFLDRRKDARPEQAHSAVLWTLINSAEFVSNH